MSAAIECDIAIIGGGFAGVALISGLARAAAPGTSIVLCAEESSLGTGRAYATRRPEHLLNVPACRLGTRPDDPAEFYDWMKSPAGIAVAGAHDPDFGPNSFVQRTVFGRFITAQLEAALVLAGERGVSIRVQSLTVIAITAHDQKLQLALAGGTSVLARDVALATGVPPRQPIRAPLPGYSANPWADWAEHSPAAMQPEGHAVVIGTGPTGIDAALTLRARGFSGPITMIGARSGMPRPHLDPFAFGPDPATAETIRTAMRQAQGLRAKFTTLRRLIRALPTPWQWVIDALRPDTDVLWASLSLADQALFRRRLAGWWSVHRHRLPPAITNAITADMESGRLIVRPGRVFDVRPIEAGGLEIGLSHAGESLVLRATLVIEATGQERRARVAAPCSAALLDDGTLQETATGGLVCDPQGLAASNGAWRIFALGALLTGGRIETTAVPEIRDDAARIVAVLTTPTV